MITKFKKQPNLIGSSFLLKNLLNYNKWIVQNLNSLYPINGKILEFGCGFGGISTALSSLPGVQYVIANDISVEVKSFFSRHKKKKSKIIFKSDNILVNPKKFSNLNYDIAITSNTIEHIKNDGDALRMITKFSKKKTSLVLVPALPCLYGTCDFDGGHYRRYTKSSFLTMCEKSGLKVSKIKYVNMIGVFGWWYKYVFLKQRDYNSNNHSASYSIFNNIIVPFYSKFEKLIYCPFGLSLIASVHSNE
jgi:hypothetical protein